LGFQPIGVEGLDKTVVRLMKEPIHLAQAFIQPDRGPVIISGINKETAAMCTALHGLTRKYPFRPDEERENVSLAELTAWFAPETGRIAQFRAKSLGELVIRDGPEWKAKDPAKKPQVTPELLDFLRRSDAITNAFFGGGGTQPHLSYTLRPALQGKFKDGILELEIDGQLHRWTSKFQKAFTWPGPEGKDSGARAWVNMGDLRLPFASHAGLWGIFRIMKDAKKRPAGSKVVEWTEVRPAGGRLEPIEPVDVEIVQFPGGVDMFNPEFFSTYQCPMKAVQ
jgi:type VI protein secretion system component VasK